MNYFGLDEEFAGDNSKVAIVPVPYELTTSYGKGTAKGPQAILTASQQVELFDDELWCEPFQVGVKTLQPVIVEPVSTATLEPFAKLTKVVSDLLAQNKFPVILGGEHSLSLGPVLACAKKYPDLSILQIDAHADCRKSYEGNAYSHASVTYQIYQKLPSKVITEVGIRNISSEEVEWFQEEKPSINIYWARNRQDWNFEEIVNSLTDNVYLTIDVDGLDPSIMPSTGTPEPDGMTWKDLTDLVRLLCLRKNVVAADIVELSPIENLHAPDFLAAKLLYKLIGYRFCNQKEVKANDRAFECCT